MDVELVFWATTDEVVDESGVTDDLVTMEDVVDATDCDTTEDFAVEDDAFTVAIDFVAMETGLLVAFVVAAHDEMSDEIRSAIVSTTSLDENER